MKPLVVSLCDRTGVAVEPWAKAGYPCLLVDTQHPKGKSVRPDGVVCWGEDVFDWAIYSPAERIGILFAFPPCTDLASSGARWFAQKGLTACIDALRLVDKCRQIAESTQCPYFIENPVGRLSTCWRKPDYLFQPCDFGGYCDPPTDHYTKKTCLWVGGGFRMPEPKPVTPTEGSKMHLLPPSADRADLRSVTPKGFAQAVFEANEPLVRGLE